MKNTNNVIAFRPRPRVEDTDLYHTGAHMVSALKDEFEMQGLMTRGLAFSFDMLLYGMKTDRTS